jgi:hypothetical protein
MATASTEDIERIVREVIAQLSTAAPRDAAGPPVRAVESAASPAARVGDVHVDARVVTLETVADRLQGAKQLIVPPDALVTPAVRDELRRKGINLVHGAAAASTKEGLPRILFVSGRTRQDATATVQMLTQQGLDVQVETLDCIIASTDKLAAAVAQDRALGVLWTRHTAAGLCLANRHANVRAVLAAGVTVTSAAVSAVGANVLVVDPTLGSAYERKKILGDFCLGGIRPCPEALRERLGTRRKNLVLRT